MKLIDINTMKFDIVLMNPPYDNGLHLVFLKKTSEISNKIISVQPCNWLYLNSSQKRTKDVRELVNRYHTEAEVYKNGRKLFDEIRSKSYISILNIDCTKEDDYILIKDDSIDYNISEYHNIDDVKLFGNDPIWKSIYNKIILDKGDKLESHAHVYKDIPGIIAYFQKVGNAVDRNDINRFIGKWVFTHTSMAGHEKANGEPSDDWYTIIGKKSLGSIPHKFEDIKDDLKCFYIFDTKEECQNFIDYVKTDFARSILYMVKIGKESIFFDKYAPWLDFKEKWNDEKLFEKYNITKEEQEKIREVLPDYYGIRK